MGIYCLPSCDWFSRWVYTTSPPVIGSDGAGVRACVRSCADREQKARAEEEEQKRRKSAEREQKGRHDTDESELSSWSPPSSRRRQTPKGDRASEGTTKGKKADAKPRTLCANGSWFCSGR
eukprot:1195779-Prorocentrum_minimum.AAC.5